MGCNPSCPPSISAAPARIWHRGGVDSPTLVTVGHGTLGADGLVDLLHGGRVAALVDVRRYPGSRRQPSLRTDALADRLPVAGIAYRWDPRLGGRRQEPPDSPDTWWRVASFRAYAAHMRTPEFTAAVDELVATVASTRTAIMCGETLWWRCHRRLISDYVVLVRGGAVEHLMPGPVLRPHPVAAGARLTAAGTLVYDRS